MNLNEIKIGAKLACDAKIAEIDGDVVYIEFSAHKKFRLGAEMVELLDAQILRPENGIKNSEPAPKYDPCRKFRKGDKVRLIRRYGRTPHEHAYDMDVEEDGVERTVLWDEKEALVSVTWGVDDDICVPFFYLELVTPVEELEPYNVKFLQAGEVPDTYYYWAVMDNMGHEVARFWHEQYEKGQAEAAAEAECARLNAEYRKEQK
jgi:hypothetical protein